MCTQLFSEMHSCLLEQFTDEHASVVQGLRSQSLQYQVAACLHSPVSNFKPSQAKAKKEASCCAVDRQASKWALNFINIVSCFHFILHIQMAKLAILFWQLESASCSQDNVFEQPLLFFLPTGQDGHTCLDENFDQNLLIFQKTAANTSSKCNNYTYTETGVQETSYKNNAIVHVGVQLFGNWRVSPLEPTPVCKQAKCSSLLPRQPCLLHFLDMW